MWYYEISRIKDIELHKWHDFCFETSICANFAMVRSRKPVKTSLYMRYSFQDKGVKGRQLLKASPNYSKSKIYRHAQLPIDAADRQDKRKCNKGRPRKLIAREVRNLVRELQKLKAILGQSGLFLQPDFEQKQVYLLKFH